MMATIPMMTTITLELYTGNLVKTPFMNGEFGSDVWFFVF
jgi:hypothetical protein